jgi:hypothetical protein
VIFHEPIETSRLTIKDLDTLKDEVFQVIDDELKKNLNSELINNYITYP